MNRFHDRAVAFLLPRVDDGRLRLPARHGGAKGSPPQKGFAARCRTSRLAAANGRLGSYLATNWNVAGNGTGSFW